MSNSLPETSPPGPGHDWFATTHWSVVLAAGRDASARALDQLCRTYWYPLYVYIRRRGYPTPEAEDLTQEFFAQLLARNDLAIVNRSKGKFRSFLLASLNHFLANQWDKQRAEKRGGKCAFVSFDDQDAERRFSAELAQDLPPEAAFDRRWALTVLDLAYANLRQEFHAAGKAEQFVCLKRFLASEGASADYAAAGIELSMTVNHVAVTVHRMRQKLRQCIRAAIAQTVSHPSEIDGEMRYLLELLRQ